MINNLKELFYKNFSIDLSSSVFKEMTLSNPSVTVWISGDDISITSTKDYNYNKYFNDSIIKIYETKDFDDIVSLYRIAAFGYIYEKEEILANLISFLESKKEFKLIKVDNKKSNKYN